MASLTGLPPLPRSLHGLWEAGRTEWQETERRLMIKASIQQDLQHRHSNGYHRQGRPTPRSLQAAIAHLRREMVSLRQLDMSLLCQLWSLNEGLLDLKACDPHTEADFGGASFDCSGDESAPLAEVEEDDGDYLVPVEDGSWLAQSLLGEASSRSSAADSVLEAAIEDSERQHSYNKADLQRPHSYSAGDRAASSQPRH